MAFHLRRGTRAILTAVILTLAAAGAARAAAPAVLDQIPSDAKVAIVINNVKTLSTKLSNAAVRLNIPAPPDLIGYATRLAGITKGFDPNGSAAVVIIKPTEEPKDDEVGPPPAIILLPTTDPKAMLEGFQPGEADKDGISELNLPGSTDKGYALTIDKWVALAQSRDQLAAYLKRQGSLTKSLPEASLKVFEANDLVVWSNIPVVAADVDKWLDDRQQEATGALDLANMNKSVPETTAAIQKAAICEAFGAAKQYFKDAQSAIFTLRLSDAGVTLGTVGTFKPDTPMGNFVAAQKPAKPLNLQGLPGGDFLLASAAEWDGKTVGDAFANVLKRVMADEVLAKNAKAADIAKLGDEYQQLFALTTGMHVVLQDKGGDKGIMNGAAIIDTTDPAKYIALTLELYKNPLIKELGNANPDIEQTITVTPDALTLKNTKLTKVVVQWKLREETADKPLLPGSKEAYSAITKMYGGDNATAYFGEAGKNVVSVFGNEPATLEAGITAALANASDLDNNSMVTGSKEQVVPNTVGVAYLPVTRWMGVMQTMIPGLPPLLPAGGGAGGAAVPPVVASVGVSGNTLTMELHVPITAISAVKDAVTRVLQGGGMTPPPGADGGMNQ